MTTVKETDGMFQEARTINARGDILLKIEVPEASKHCNIVLPNKDGYGFKTNCYDQKFLKNIIEKRIFDSTIKNVNKICDNIRKMKKKEEMSEFKPHLKYIIYFSIFLSFIAFLLLAILVHGSSYGYNDLLLAIIIIMIVASASMTLAAVIISVYSQPKFLNFEKATYFKINEYLTG